MPYLGNEVAPLVQALEGKELKLDSEMVIVVFKQALMILLFLKLMALIVGHLTLLVTYSQHQPHKA